MEGKQVIRRAYSIEGKRMRSIAREQHCSRKAIRKVLADAGPETCKQRIAALRAEEVAAAWVVLTHERAGHLDPDAIPVVARSNPD